MHIGQIISVWLGIAVTIGTVIAGYAKLTQRVKYLESKCQEDDTKLSVLDSAESINANSITELKTKVDVMDKRIAEDRETARENFNKFFDAQNQLSGLLKEVSTILNQLDKNTEQRLSRLETKIDQITSK